MTGQSINHIDEDDNSDEDENSDKDEHCDEDTSSADSSPFLPPKPTYDPTAILISSHVQAGYISCKEWRLSSSVHSSSGTF